MRQCCRPPVFAGLIATALMISDCKTPLSSKLADNNSLVGIDHFNDAAGIAAAVYPTSGFKATLPEEKVEFYRGKFNAINNADNWSKHRILETSDLGNGNSAVILREYVVRMQIAGFPDVGLDIVLNQDDVLGSAGMVKNLLAQSSSGFFDNLEVRNSTSTAGSILGVNLFANPLSIKKSPSDSPKSDKTSSETTNETSSSEATPEPTAESKAENFLSAAQGDVLQDVLKTNRTALALPLYTISVGLLNQNRTIKTSQILPGDVFTVSYAGNLYGSGFGIWLGKKPLHIPLTMEANVLAFGRLSPESFERISQIFTPMDTKASHLVTKAEVEQLRTSNLNANKRAIKGELEVLGYRVDRNFIEGSIKISDPNQGRVPNFYSLEQQSRSPIQGISSTSLAEQMPQIAVEAIKLKQKYVEVNSALQSNFQQIAQNFVKMKQKDFEWFNSLEADFDSEDSKTEFYSTTLFDKVNLYIQNGVFRRFGASLNDNDKAWVSTVVDKGEELAKLTQEIKFQTKTVMKKFNYVGERIKFGNDKLIYRLEGIRDSGAYPSMGMFAAMFDTVADAYVKNQEASIWKWQNDIFLGQYKNVSKELADCFKYDPMPALLKELTGEQPPQLRWNVHSVSYDYNNIDKNSRDEIAAYFRNNAHKIYFGLDNLRIEYGPGIYSVQGGPNKNTELGVSRIYRLKGIIPELNKLLMLTKRRIEGLVSWSADLEKFQERVLTPIANH